MNRREVKKAPVLRFKGFTNDWEQHKLGDETNRIKSYSISHGFEVAEDTGTKYIHYGDIHTSKVKIINNIDVLPNIKDNNYKPLKYGDVIVADASEDYKGIADACIVNTISDSYKIVAGLHTIAFRPKSKLCSKFLYFYLSTDIFKHFEYKTGTGLKVFGISYKELAKFKLKEPSVTEQKKIVKLLFLIENAINLQQRKLKLLRTLKSGLSFKLFNKKHLNNLSQISLDQIGQTYSGLTGKSKKDFGHGHAFYVSYLNVNQNEIGNPKQIDRIEIDKKQNLVQKNDIFFTISSETPEEVGLTSLWPVSCKRLYLNSFCFGFRINTKMFIPLYLGYLFRSEYFREKVLPLAQGISRYNLSKNNVLKIKIGQEEIAIQEKYAKVMNDLDSDILRQKKKVKELKLCKKFLLQNMFI